MSFAVNLPDELRERVAQEANRRHITPDELVAEIVAERVEAPRPHRLSFAGIGASTSGRRAADVEDWLHEEFRR